MSQRELVVLRLIAEGRSNREIGEHLFISQHTAANHVRPILQKWDAPIAPRLRHTPCIANWCRYVAACDRTRFGAVIDESLHGLRCWLREC